LKKGVFQAQEGFPGWSVEEKLERSLVKLKLLTEERLVDSLVGLKLLAEEDMDPSLVKLELLLGGKMVGPLVKSDLKHVEEKNSPKFDSPIFLLQITSKG
jgi:hypothetical protein